LINFVLQAEAEKPELSRQKKKCLAMKTLNLEQMEVISGGKWLNNHTFKEHLICIGWGALGAVGGPMGTVGAMILCYAA
jgi:hypothetical protein